MTKIFQAAVDRATADLEQPKLQQRAFLDFMPSPYSAADFAYPRVALHGEPLRFSRKGILPAVVVSREPAGVHISYIFHPPCNCVQCSMRPYSLARNDDLVGCREKAIGSSFISPNMGSRCMKQSAFYSTMPSAMPSQTPTSVGRTYPIQTTVEHYFHLCVQPAIELKPMTRATQRQRAQSPTTQSKILNVDVCEAPCCVGFWCSFTPSRHSNVLCVRSLGLNNQPTISQFNLGLLA